MKKRIQWHPAFCSSMELIFQKYNDILDYDTEHELSRKPLQMDLLIIDKMKDTPIDHPIGRIFKTHNILEYKSPTDSLNIDDYYKTVAYGCLYKALTAQHVNAIPADDITLTLVRDGKPVRLMKQLEADKITIVSKEPGVYYLVGNTLFATQIIVGKELDEQGNLWLKALSRNIGKDTVYSILNALSKKSTDETEKRNKDAVASVMFSANGELRQWMEENKSMWKDTLREVMKPEFDAVMAESMARGKAEGIKQGKAEGIEKGIEEGIEKGRAEAAAAMLKDGYLPMEKIAQYTGLSMSELDALQKEVSD